ncbi:hypothetical protein ACN9MH_17325 [Paenibacillus silvae]|uniref:nSTAND3 domain-containing NTPase n=1 Tax=Paenibacillus silvae TaxID=1325358 RepID=UPI003CEF4B70
MSIEVTGTQGYDYQYLQTIYLTLLMWGRDGISLIVEKKDGEDAELQFSFEGNTVTIEVQVKSEQGNLEMDSLAKWVGHFPDRKESGNLLERIENDNLRSALFITRSRCSDSTQTFLSPIGTIEEHSNSPLQGQLADTFLNALSKAFEEKGQTPLKKRRDDFCKNQALRLSRNKGGLREIAQRILIWERADMISIQNEVIRLLKLQHISEQVAPTVVSEMEKAVRMARDIRGDVIPLVREILYNYAGNRAFSRPVHVPREDINHLNRDLEEKSVLLLTGISFCGKSHLAEWIAEQFRAEQGYTYAKETQLDSAYRYLMVASSESRICFLEDPFGHTNLSPDATNTWSRLHDLTTKLAPHRKLIVTSRKDLIQALSGSSSIEAWSFGECQWRDLTVSDAKYSINVWSAYSSTKHLPDDVGEIVVEGMRMNNSAVLQPGQIRHLAFSEQTKLKDRSFEELASLARVDAYQLGQTFLNRKPPEQISLMILVLGNRLGIGMAEQDFLSQLQFVFDELGVSEGMGQAEAFCEELERAGYIQFVNGRWMFSHPTYYEAAMHVVENQQKFGQRRLLVILSHLFRSESVFVMLNAIRSLERIYEAYSMKDIRSEIRKIAIQSLTNPYPTMRDEALVLLASRIKDLPPKEIQVIMSYIKSYHFSDQRIEWHDGIPRLTDYTQYTLWQRMMERKNEDISRELFLDIAHRLQSPDEAFKVIPEEAWHFARGLDVHELDAEVKLPVLKQLLTYKEAFIREAAAFNLVHEYGENRRHLDLVLSDPHPFVVLQGIQGCFQGWSRWSLKERDWVLKNLQEVLMVKVNCLAAHEFMIQFSQKPHRFRLDWEVITSEERADLHRLWGKLLPIFLEHVPNEFLEIDEAYLFETTSKEASVFTEDQVVQITEAWVEWVERTISHKRPSDYGMGYLDFLLAHTNTSITYREKLAIRLLSHQNSYIVSMSLAEYVNYWPSLHHQEQTQVIMVLQSGRSDVRWLKAIALTREEISREICLLLLGEADALTLPLAITELISKTDSQLIRDCIEVFDAERGELYNLVGTSREYIWPSMALEILRYPDHPAFANALSYALRRVISTSANKSFKECVLQACINICKCGPKNVVRMMVEIIFKWTVRVNGADSRELWEILYQNLDEKETEEITANLADVIEAISTNYELPSELIGVHAYSLLLNQYLTSDKIIWFLDQNNDLIETDGIVSFLDLIFTQSPPRVHLSYLIVKSLFKDREDDGVQEFLSKVEIQRKELIRTASNKDGDKYYYKEPLEGWLE